MKPRPEPLPLSDEDFHIWSFVNAVHDERHGCFNASISCFTHFRGLNIIADRVDADIMLFAVATRRQHGPGPFWLENGDCSDFIECGGVIFGSPRWGLPLT